MIDINRAPWPTPQSVQAKMSPIKNILVLAVFLTLAVRSSCELPRGPGPNFDRLGKPPYVNINLGGEYNDIVTSYKVWISCRILYLFALLRFLSFLIFFLFFSFFVLLPVMQRVIVYFMWRRRRGWGKTILFSHGFWDIWLPWYISARCSSYFTDFSHFSKLNNFSNLRKLSKLSNFNTLTASYVSYWYTK